MQQLSLLSEFPLPPDCILSDLMNVNIHYDAVEALLEEYLQEELEQFETLDVKAVPETNLSVKWKYSSALQKSIRRGYVEDSVKYALTYHSLDSVSFWNRLVIIAFEDCGVADVKVVAMTLAAARSKLFRQKLGGDKKVIHYLIKKLAESVKDRTVADMCQVLENRSLSTEALTLLKTATHDELSSITLTERHHFDLRIAAAWMLWGTDKMKNGRFPLRSGYRELFDHSIEQMKMPGLVKYITLRGMTACKGCAMNLTYPFVWLMMKQSPYVKVIETDLPQRYYIKDLPEFAYDKHTREGKAGYQNFYRSCPAVNEYLTTKGIVGRDEVTSAIGIAMFISESALLDRRINFQGAEEIYQMTVEDDYGKNGLSLSEGKELARLIGANSDILRLARTRAVEGERV